MTTTTFTTSPFSRSHGREPRGRGGWAFQQTTRTTAYDSEVFGPVVFFNGTYTEAKRAAAAHFGPDATVAVMP